jgi:glycosyltransferase involved in cell wall biosynthesis
MKTFNDDKILVFSHDTRIGGATVNILRLADTLSRLYGLTLQTIVMQGGTLLERFAAYGPVHTLNLPFAAQAKPPGCVAALVKNLAAAGYGRVIANTVISGALAGLFKKHGMAVVSLIHEMPTLMAYMGLERNAQNAALHSDALIFASDYVRNRFPHPRLIKNKALVLEQGIRKYRYNGTNAQARADLRAKMGLPGTAKIILGCGMGEPRKGVDLLPQIAAYLLPRCPDAHFVWLGEIFNAETKSWLRHDGNVLGIAKHLIEHPNFEPDPALFFEGADVFILPSREDPFPSVVLEAMKCRLPCLGFTGNGGSQAMLEQGRGILVPYLDTARMAESLADILNAEPDMHTGMLEKAAAYARPFTYERYASELLFILRHSGKKPPRIAPDRATGPLPTAALRILHCIPRLGTDEDLGRLEVMAGSSHAHGLFMEDAPDLNVPAYLDLFAEFPEKTPYPVILDRAQAFAPDVLHIHTLNGCYGIWLRRMRLLARILDIPLLEDEGVPAPRADAEYGETVRRFRAEQQPQRLNSPWPFKTVFMAVHDYILGGGEIVAQRMANELAKHCRVYMYNARPELPADEDYLRHFSPEIILLPSTGRPEEFRSYVRLLDPDIVNSHVWWSEIVVYQAIHNLPIPWFLITHGCHETLLHDPACDPRHAEYGVKVLSRADRVIYVADKNREILEKHPEIGAEKYVKMLNGCVALPFTPKTRAESGIQEEDIVFCLVSRAIPEKGWDIGIECALRVTPPGGRKAHIILVGDGEMHGPLRNQYKDNPRVHFAGLSSNPLEWMSIADIGLLPTRYLVESQPLVIGEFITAGVPVVATDAGDIPQLLCMDGIQTGLVCPLTKDRQVDQPVFLAAMHELVDNDALYTRLKANTRHVAPKFSIQASCAAAFSGAEPHIHRYRENYGRP